MSIEWMNHVWNNSKHRASRLLMMIAIADYANEKGQAFPSVETLADRTRQTTRNALRIIEKLIASGELASEKYASPYGTNLYTLKVSTKPKRKKKPSKRSSDILGNVDKTSDIPEPKSTESSDIPVPEMSHDPPLTITNPPKEKAAPGARTPLLDNKAVLIFKSLMKRWPNITQRQAIANEVNDSDLQAWENILKEWLLSGHNPVNVKGQLDAFRNGGLRSGKSGGTGKYTRGADQGRDVGQEWADYMEQQPPQPEQPT